MNQQKPLRLYENRPIINMDARFPSYLVRDMPENYQDLMAKHNYQERVQQKNTEFLNNSMEFQQNTISAVPNNKNYQSHQNLKSSPIQEPQDIYQSNNQRDNFLSGQIKQQNPYYEYQQADQIKPAEKRQPANPNFQQSPHKIYSSTSKVALQGDRFLTPVTSAQNNLKASPNPNDYRLSASNKQLHKPIFGSGTQQPTQALNDIDISEIRYENYDNDKVKRSHKYQTQERPDDDRIKRSHNPNENSSFLNSPGKNIKDKRIFGEGGEQLNKSSSYIKNIELLNSEERIKKSKIFQSLEQTQGPQQVNPQSRVSYIENSQAAQVQDKYAREKADKEQELKKLTLEQVFCQNCLEFIHYETVDVIERHITTCKSIEEVARVQTNSFIQKERELHNSFIDDTDNKQIEKQQIIQIINSKLEKLRYLLMKMTNVLQDSDFLLAKPELKAYNFVEIKKSLEKISHQDVDCRFIESCLENIEHQEKEFDIIQRIYCTPESTQYLQIIRTIPELVKTKIEYIQQLQQLYIY